MSDDIFKEAKKRVVRYLNENYPTTEEGKLYKAAKKRVKAKKGFFTHLAVFIPVMTFLMMISVFMTPHVWWWFLFPLGGWGIALAIQYFSVFGIPGVGRFDSEWEAVEIEEEYRKLREQKDYEEYLRNRSLEEDETLELKDLEKRYREDDLL